MERAPVLAAILFSFGLLAGCADPAPNSVVEASLEKQARELAELLTQTEISAVSGQGGVLVSLAFGSGSDLDLYVTDPLSETVYFANHKSRSGGIVSGDARCDTQGPRIETVRFEKPLTGQYRVGVDYPENCDGHDGPAAFAVSVQGAGVNKSARGTIDLSRFEVIVLEFEVSG
jgi:uncharacterized protein YfaP (DUF2135 family)